MRILGEFRFERATQPLTNVWEQMSLEPRGSTLLGISFRPTQAATLGINAHTALQTLLAYPFQLIRLAAYWNHIEPSPGSYTFEELDWQVDAAEQAGKQIMVSLGPLKNFSYPEWYVPTHQLHHPFPEHRRIKPLAYPSLMTAATAFLAQVVERYRHRDSIVAWQLEHEAVDPLGVEHSWRLDADLVRQEMEALKHADPTRPVMMNGFLPTSLLIHLAQWWRTRDQGDSLAVAQRLADIVGIDYYPRNALMTIGSRTLYLDGSASPLPHQQMKRILAWTSAHGRKLMIAEGQAEPWETVTIPPDPQGQGMYSCLPEQVIANFNTCMRWSHPHAPLYAYLFWGAEYWLLRQQQGDTRYLQAFARVLENSPTLR